MKNLQKLQLDNFAGAGGPLSYMLVENVVKGAQSGMNGINFMKSVLCKVLLLQSRYILVSCV